MTNLEALYETCNSIANTFFPSEGTLMLTLANSGLNATDEYEANNIDIIKAALELVQGFVATLQIEGDVHNDTNWDAVRANIIRISKKYGLDPGDFISLSRVSDKSYLW